MTGATGGGDQVSAESGTLRPPSPLVPPGERGATRIADRVVAKIAAQAAREALPHPPGEAAAPHATVVVRHGTARVRVHLALGYPCDIGARCAAVRRQVAERVGGLADLEVAEVAVRIERLHLPAAPGTVGRAR
ncbi:Asp23/Gls24 family envelope stress response protein [Streptomyces sp. NPDC014846]|uniref:Asp23/Gls24 family envelope stress response protein n=1 Tax=unclassified Streptomyces TaxID=2593676 RepID=UPI0036F6E365